MEINKDSLLYKIAYKWGSYKPNQANLCRFFWRVVLSLFIVWPIFVPGVFLIFIVIIGVEFVILFFIAKRPAIFKDDPVDYGQAIYYRKWPQLSGYRILPIHVVLVGFLFWGIGWHGLEAWEILSTFPKDSIFRILTISVILITGWVILLLWIIKMFKESSFYELFKAYLAAKKQKICPLIDFTE